MSFGVRWDMYGTTVMGLQMGIQLLTTSLCVVGWIICRERVCVSEPAEWRGLMYKQVMTSRETHWTVIE